MKSNIAFKDVNPSKAENIIFIKAATMLIQELKSPANFLDFLSQALSWIDYYNREVKNITQTSNNFLIVMIEQVVQPWLSGKGSVNKIAKGLYQAYDYFGYEGFYDMVGIIMTALAVECQCINPGAERMKSYFQSLNAIWQVGAAVENYKHEVDAEKQKQLV